MTDEPPARGRLFLITAPSEDRAAAVAGQLGDRLERAFVVSGSQIGAMVVPGPGADAPSALERVRALLLRWSACLAAAETFLLEGYDAVVHDTILGEHLEDFLDLCAPETVHVVVLDDAAATGTPRWGLWLDPSLAADAVADELLARLEESEVLTAEPTGVGDEA